MSELPQYSPESLAIPLLGLARVPTGVYIESVKDVASLKLFDQNPKAAKGAAVTQPTYGRGSPIRGEVEISSRLKLEKIEHASLTLEGYVKLDSYDGFPSKTEIVNLKKDLFSKSSGSSSCGPNLSFSFTFPTEEDLLQVVPPTFQTAGKDADKAFAKVYYRLVLVIQVKHMLRNSLKRCVSLSTSTTIRGPLRQPTTYHFDPHQNWHKVTKEIRAKQDAPSNITPITCNFYIPASGTFGFTDVIPFHIQLKGTSPAMDEFLQDSPSTSISPNKGTFIPVKMKVTFMRKVIIKPLHPKPAQGYNEEVTLEVILGEASVVSLPSLGTQEGEDGGLVVTEWGGEIRCKEESMVMTGSLAIDGLRLEDHLMLAVNPQHPNLMKTRIAVPVRLVTDPWVEGDKKVAKMTTLRDKAIGAGFYGAFVGF